MAFTESFGLGNSTFMDIETEVNKALKVVEKPSKPKNAAKQNPNPIETIDESPTNSKGKSNKSHSRHHVSQFSATRRKKFQKSKSDSTLAEKTNIQAAQISSKDNYSEFFKSEFSIEESKSESQSFVSTSHIEAAINKCNPNDANENVGFGFGYDNTKMFSKILSDVKCVDNEDIHENDTSEVFDAPVFSEDLEDFLKESSQMNDVSLQACSDDDWKESLKLSEFENDISKIETNYDCVPVHEPKKNQSVNVKNDNTAVSNLKENVIVNEKYDSEPEIDFVNIDDATFICPDEKGKDFAERTILEIKNEMQTSLQEDQDYSNNKILFNVSTKEKSVCPILSNKTGKRSSGEVETLAKLKQPYEIKHDLEELKRISAWNLPLSVLKQYEKKGIQKMFDWQIECLSNPKVLFEHCNLVYSAPTSAGKTLVSEILLIKTILERGKKVILILPFISVVREKMFYLQDLLTPSGYRVEGFFGGYTPPGGFHSINVAICTIEKANSIINKLLEQGKLDEIGTVVVDEVHLISDPGRGYILELLLAKVLYMSKKFNLQIQIITMSATLANVELLKKWLDAELYITNYRPVALEEMIKIGTKIYNNNLEFIREISSIDFNEINDQDHVAQLCIETLAEGFSVVVFCPSKDWCENLSLQLAGAIHTIGRNGSEIGNKLRSNIKRDAIEEVKKQLRDIPTGLDSVLEKTINFGCAFHHAGLTTEERDIVEGGFKNGSLKIIVATSTLSSGVNLPARRVIIRSPLFGGKQMSSLTYKQMIGRAGRAGRDTLGESILICTESNSRVGKDLITAELNPISSCLEMESSSHLKRALLEVISSGVATSKTDIENFVKCTLLNAQKELLEKENSNKTKENNNTNVILDSINFLIEYEFVRLQRDEENDQENYVATRLGMACLASSMPPTDGLILFSELQKSRRCFVLESELHAVYLVTPYSVCYQLQDLDWLMYLDLWEKLSPSMKKVGELVGVKESFLVRAMRGQIKLDYKLLQIHKRFYTALALQELVNETPVNTVAVKYKCTRGMLQSLQQMASTFAGIVTAFCDSLNWSMLSLIVGQFKERLFFGVHRDLIDLMRLPDLNYKRARVLFDAGIQNLIDLANADAFTVEKILHNSLSFDTAKKLENEDEYEKNKRNNMRNFFITGKADLTVQEAAKMLIADARQFMQYEIGVENINWSKNESKEQREISNLEVSVGAACSKRKSNSNCSDVTPPKIKKVTSSEERIVNQEDINKQVKNPSIVTNNQENEIKNNYITQKTSLVRDPCSSKTNIKSNHSELRFTSLKSTPKGQITQNGSSKENVVPNGKPIIKSKSGISIPSTQTKNEDETGHQEKSNNIQTNSDSLKNVEKKVETKKQATNSIDSRQNKQSAGETKTISKVNLVPSKRTTSEQISCESGTSHRSKDHLQIKYQDKTNNVHTNTDAFKIGMKKTETPKSQKPIKTDANDVFQIKNDKPIEQQNDKKIKEFKKEKELIQKNKTETNKKTITSPKVRRSPRNHLPSSTRIEKSSSKTGKTLVSSYENDLFMDDDASFELNSAIANAMDTDKNSDAQPSRKSLNKSSDEIAPSQEITFQPKTQSTRLLRSYKDRTSVSTKTPARAINPPRKNEKQSSPAPQQDQNSVDPQKNKSKTLEVSDITLENSLMQNPIRLNSSHILSTSKTEPDALLLKSIQIIDICGSQMLFKNAIKELNEAKVIGFSIGIEKQPNKQTPLIGSKLLINQQNKINDQNEEMLFRIDNISYLACVSMVISENVSLYLNLQEENIGKNLTKDMKIEALKSIIENSNLTLQIFDAKEQLKILRKVIPEIDKIQCKIEDPKVANWLLQPDKTMSLGNMAHQFAPECIGLVQLSGTKRGYNSIGLDYTSAIFGRIRSSIEACVTKHILKGQIENLERIGSGQLYKFFIDLEMPLQVSLCEMETYGFPANEKSMQELYQKMTDTMRKLETKIYDAHGSKFNLGSSSAVARVVGLHRKTSGRISTSKQILENIDSPIAQMIVVYRKLSVTLSKTVQPLLRSIVNDRIHGQSITFTSSGRISMQEPNLQNVAKDFEVTISVSEKLNISCRSSFFPSKGRSLISADFCQLEMRIMAHLSQDPQLLQVMNSEKDVFTSIAAKWNKLPEENVSEQLRNGTKQICYGIVYGMGLRSLAESLKCTEQEAKTVSEQFHAAYPGIRLYTDKVIKFARQHGYVETITGRRRYLDNINSGEPQLKSQAERQAVNSAIQGSAADIAKSAILRMEKNVNKYKEKMGLHGNCVNLVLHLHDELIFEVPEDKARKVAKVLSITMENCVRLSVPLKVKLKIGKSWGSLAEVKL